MIREEQCCPYLSRRPFHQRVDLTLKAHDSDLVVLATCCNAGAWEWWVEGGKQVAACQQWDTAAWRAFQRDVVAKLINDVINDVIMTWL